MINFARVKILPNVLTFVRDISEETVSKSVKDFSEDEEEVKTASTPNPPSTPIPTPVEIKNTVDINQINSIIGTDANRADISVCIYDLKNKAYYRTGNSAKRMSASALINIPILYTAENSMKNHDVSWSSRVRFKYMYSGREVIKSNQNGSEFELSYLLEQMMSYSDNNITNSLIDYWGSSYIESVCAQNGYNSVEIQKYLGESSQTRDNYICADDAVDMMREMYESGVAIDEDYLKSCFRISDSARFDGLGKYLPSEAGFLNHNALTSTIYNEIGIIYSDKSEYIIAVLSNNGNSETSADTVARVSDYVYRELNK